MTDYQNAESLRREYLTRTPRKTLVNVCKARPRWNGCDYCDVYSGTGLECWKQDAPHNCYYCKQEQRKGATAQ